MAGTRTTEARVAGAERERTPPKSKTFFSSALALDRSPALIHGLVIPFCSDAAS